MKRRLDPKLGYSRWSCFNGHKHVSESRARECERKPNAKRSAAMLFGPLALPSSLPPKALLCDLCNLTAVIVSDEHTYCARHGIEAAEAKRLRRMRKP